MSQSDRKRTYAANQKKADFPVYFPSARKVILKLVFLARISHFKTGADPHRFPPFYENRSCRFFIINIFLINKELSKFQGFIRGEWNWPTSCLNDSESQEKELRELKSKPDFTGEHVPGLP